MFFRCFLPTRGGVLATWIDPGGDNPPPLRGPILIGKVSQRQRIPFAVHRWPYTDKPPNRAAL